MAKSTSKRGAKAQIATATSTSIKTSPPEPYEVPPPVLVPFLQTLDPQHIYLVHIDTHLPGHKRKIFTVPVLMNVAFVALLLWRAWVAIPYYAHILLPMLGHSYGANESIAGAPLSVIIDVTTKRAGMFFMDFALVRFVGAWPRDFFIGYPASPFTWRYQVGFQRAEVVVRRSRKWDEGLEKGWLDEEKRDTDKVYTERILPAVKQTWLQEKTSYLMMDKSWDLDFAHMIRAHQMIDDEEATIADFRTMVMVHTEAWGWLIWSVWKLEGEDGSEEGRQKIVLFKDKLTAMGKEHLFYRWIELIQYESSLEGGFTWERQAKAMGEARRMFESQGVDFEKFWESMGGMSGLPGMDVAR